MPAAGVCISPWVDLDCVGDSMTTRATVDPWIDREYLPERQPYTWRASTRTPRWPRRFTLTSQDSRPC
jgi:hypothetical protein